MSKFWKVTDFSRIKGKTGIYHGVEAKVVALQDNSIVVQLAKPDYFGSDIPILRQELGIHRKHHKGANNIFAKLSEAFPIDIKDIPIIGPVSKFEIGEKVMSTLKYPVVILGAIEGVFPKYICRIKAGTGWSRHANYPNFVSSAADLWVFHGHELCKIKEPPIEYRVTIQDNCITVYDSKGHKGTAKCHPEDTFDFGYGVNVAKARCAGYKRYLPKQGDTYFRVGLPSYAVFQWSVEQCYNDVLAGNIFHTECECDAFRNVVKQNRTDLLQEVLHENNLI